MRSKHKVYVVELSKEVLDVKKFVNSNPAYVTGMPCVYVGMTGLDPDIRFDNHKAGILSNKYVTRFGIRLMTELFEHLNPCGLMSEMLVQNRPHDFQVMRALANFFTSCVLVMKVAI